MADLLPRHLLKEVLMTHEEKELHKLDLTVKKGRAKHDVVLAARDNALEKYVPVINPLQRKSPQRPKLDLS